MKILLFLSTLFLFLNVNAQTFTLSSPQNFTLGCGTKSVCTININPTPSTYTLTGPTGSSIVITGTPSSQGSPTINFAGTWTITIPNSTSQVQIPFSVLQNTFAPDITVAIDTQTLTCSSPSVILEGISNTQNATFSWFSSGSTSIITTNSILVNTIAPTNTLANTFTLVVTDPNNTCTSQTVVPIYQNLSSPTLNVSNAFSCPNPTIEIYLDILSSGPNLTFSWSAPSNAIISGTQTSTLTTNVEGTYTITVKDLSTGCSSNGQIIVAGCVGILKNSKEDSEPSVFPNPTSGLINLRIENFSEKTKLEIYNSLGQLILKQTIDSKITFLNLKDEAQGIYTLHLTENGEIKFKSKIIKD